MANLLGTIGNQIGVNLEAINLNWIFSFMGQLVLGLLILVVVTALIGWWLYARGQKKLYNKEAQFIEVVEGTPKETDSFQMAEISIPNTNMRVFYIKKLDLYLPRSVRKIGFRKYGYYIRSNREIVNFGYENIDIKMCELKLDFDHTDMRYANQNLEELIKRNFREQGQKWWQEYKELIGIVVFIFALTFSFFFLMGKMSDLIGQIGGMVAQQAEITESLNQLTKQLIEMKQGSGVIVKNG